MKMPHWPSPIGYRDITLGLERVQELLRRLGNPERNLPPVIHVAGTNGKGSTLAFLRAIFEAAGKKVHIYTSPHLVEFNERIVLAGEPISDTALYNVLEECRIASGELPISFFEGTTAAAFLAFSRVPADVVLLETGLGGRLDATNVLEKPALTLITSISMDHMDYLGDTLPGIAHEKACIMKKDVPCISAPQKSEVRMVLEKKAQEVGATLIYTDEGRALPELSLTGPHQQENARLAVEAATILGIAHEDILRGLRSAIWPARLQQLKTGKLRELLPPSAELWLDGGHNAAGGEALGKQAALWQDRPLYIISGMMGDKDSTGFYTPLRPFVKNCYAVPLSGEYFQKQAKPASLTAEAARKAGIPAVEAASVADALRAIAAREQGSCRVLICGSLYLAGHVLEENGVLAENKE